MRSVPHGARALSVGRRACSGPWSPAPASPSMDPRSASCAGRWAPPPAQGTPSGRPGCCGFVSVPLGFSLELSSACRSTWVTLVQHFSVPGEVCLFVLVSWESSRLALDPVRERQPVPGRVPCSAVRLHAFPGLGVLQGPVRPADGCSRSWSPP